MTAPLTDAMPQTVATIVLAGGAARRFGRDKLAEPLADGRPLLHHAIDAVRPVASGVFVVLAPGDERPLPGDVVRVHDRMVHQGPLVGVVAGLTALPATVERALIVAGDTPMLVAPVLMALLDSLADPTVAAAWLDGASPLPMVVRAARARDVGTALVDAGERRLRLLPDALGVVALPEDVWRRWDPEGITTHDIDTPADLGMP